MANGFVVTVKIVYRSDMFVFNPVRKLLLCTSNIYVRTFVQLIKKLHENLSVINRSFRLSIKNYHSQEKATCFLFTVSCQKKSQILLSFIILEYF